MSDIIKRYLLFLIGCIGTRSLFVYIAATASKTVLAYLGYLALLPAIGFMYIYITDARKTGPEVFGETIWWNSLRPIHGLLYGWFAVAAITQQSYAWKILFADVLLGLGSFLTFHTLKYPN